MRARVRRSWSIAAASLLVLVAGIFFVRRHLAGPGVVLLVPEAGAEWLTVDEPFYPVARRATEVRAAFRTDFQVGTVPAGAVLTVRALKVPTVLLDGTPVYAGAETANWKLAHEVAFGERLTPGTHRLEIKVSNRNGPGAVLAYCKPLGLFSGTGWQASGNEQYWTRARPAGQYPSPSISRRFPPALAALREHAWLYACIFVVAFGVGLRGRPLLPGAWGPFAVRSLLFVAWAILAANNFQKLPVDIGFDVDGHFAYLRYVAERGRIPLATEGWEMFQSPLYYLVAGSLYRVLSAASLPDQATVVRLLRLLSIVAGALQIEVCYRAAKYLWPGRTDLHWRGAVFGGLLPMNLYSSQTLGNEPLAGLLTASTAVVGLKLLCTPRGSYSRWTVPLLGLLLGLAILAKVTPILLMPAIGILLLVVFADAPRRQLLRTLASVYGVALGVAGWYYLRNWLILGKPFIGGWAPERGIVWWQDPGYRTLEQFYRFGDALVYPIYAGVASFWDALYSSFWLDGWLSAVARPPWNYSFMLGGAWLGILPTLAILLGALAAIRSSPLPAALGLRFVLGCVVLYLGAMFIMFLDLPMFSVGKATYMLGLTPCYAVLALAGFEQLARARVARAVFQAGVACWAVAAYAAYFVA